MVNHCEIYLLGSPSAPAPICLLKILRHFPPPVATFNFETPSLRGVDRERSPLDRKSFVDGIGVALPFRPGPSPTTNSVFPPANWALTSPVHTNGGFQVEFRFSPRPVVSTDVLLVVHAAVLPPPFSRKLFPSLHSGALHFPQFRSCPVWEKSFSASASAFFSAESQLSRSSPFNGSFFPPTEVLPVVKYSRTFCLNFFFFFP